MQELVASHPELISDQDGDLLLIRREQPVADTMGGNGRWSLDHLFVTRTGIPVLVELKRAVDTRLRREIVGQMLDYAANSTAFWQAGRIAESFSTTMAQLGRDAETELAHFLEGSIDADQFWEQIDANFAAGRIKLVFVADTIPRELARIVEFLNEQMKADVRAVELSWFESQTGVTALTPRIIGETERAQTEKAARKALTPIDRKQWIEDRIAPHGQSAVAGAERYIELIEATGGRVEVASTQGSIVGIYDSPHGILYPLSLAHDAKGSVYLGLYYLKNREPFAPLHVRQEIYDRLAAIVGALSTKTLDGLPSFNVVKLNDPAVRAGLGDLLNEIKRIAGIGSIDDNLDQSTKLKAFQQTS